MSRAKTRQTTCTLRRFSKYRAVVRHLHTMLRSSRYHSGRARKKNNYRGWGGVISVCCRHNLRMQHTLQTTTQEIKQHTMPARPLTRQLSCLASYTRRVRQPGTVLKRARSRDSQPLHITFLTTSNFLQGHSMRISPTSYASPEVQQFSDVTSFRLLKEVFFIPPVL